METVHSSAHEHTRAHTRFEPEPNVETPLQRVSGAMPVGTRERRRRRHILESGDDTHTRPSTHMLVLPSQLRAIRGPMPSKRTSVVSKPDEASNKVEASFPKVRVLHVVALACHLDWFFASVMLARMPFSLLPELDSKPGVYGKRRRLAQATVAQ